uniref:Kinesin-like protein KIN-7K, chloroplastic isoform X1 n=1 Tax=Tanacetum cinerariifolium TaxID=118510 RepID=A0A6L2P098_TANCI|nr:kinesin-like protein KIN-7K, chloroplastic isoform X1 [Tanacetum cinerariifolium]
MNMNCVLGFSIAQTFYLEYGGRREDDWSTGPVLAVGMSTFLFGQLEICATVHSQDEPIITHTYRDETTGVRRKEGSHLDKSLLTLGMVISKLTDSNAAHIPYRDSKLTQLLQSSRSGHGRVSVCISRLEEEEQAKLILKFEDRGKSDLTNLDELVNDDRKNEYQMK